MKLTDRLLKIANLVTKGKKIADIGTDHGYIPVYLALKDRTRELIAADIQKGPLNSARLSASEYGVEHSISFIQTDGLSGIPQNKADIVVIAGMGGETICGILERSGWDFSSKQLILQPMSKLPELRLWLFENGFKICDECLVKDSGEIYTVLSVMFGWQEWSCKDIHIGRALIVNRDPLLPEQLDKLEYKAKHVAAELKRSESKRSAEKIEELETVISYYEKAREEYYDV